MINRASFHRPLTLSAFGLFLAMLMTAPPAHAQFWDRIKDAARDAAADAVEDEVRNKSADAVHGAFDVAENAVRCAVGDEDCIEQARREGKPVAVTDAQGNVVKQIPAAGGVQAGGQGVGAVDANYDFKPGERTIFAEDFADDNVGDFPRSLAFRGGTMEVVQWKGGRALRVKTRGKFDVKLPETLPEQFTLTFDWYTPDFVNGMSVYPVDAEGKAVGKHHLQVDPYGDAVGIKANKRGGISSMGDARSQITSQMTPIRLMADGTYVKVYAGTKRVANIPNAELGRTRTLRFDFYDVRDQPVYIDDLRIAAGGRDLYEALSAEGRVAVQDILFDTGKATIQPASAKTLQEIATLLTEHPDLQLLIEGHTDNTGGFETNRALSKERAAAVKTYLVENHGIDGARLKIIGLGATQPAASNDTEQGRAENRRVELVKL